MNERRIHRAPVTIEERSDGQKVIVGYASVFFDPGQSGTEYHLYGDTWEKISPSAFNRAISERQDVLCVFNHDSGAILGRTASGTTRLSVDSRGLRYETDIPDTTLGRDTQTLMKRGDITGSSFAFIVRKSHAEERDKKGSMWRVIDDVDLIDVGPVTQPAYAGTSAMARDTSRIEAEIAEFRRQRQIEIDRVSVAKAKLGLTSMK